MLLSVLLATGSLASSELLMSSRTSSSIRATLTGTVLLAFTLASFAVGGLIPTSLRDFFLSGTQAGEVDAYAFFPSASCSGCHGYYDVENSPYDTWQETTMAHAGRDPLFLAQMTTAMQDVDEVGYFCMRCHMPGSFITGTALNADGSGLGDYELEGVRNRCCYRVAEKTHGQPFEI